MLHSPAALSMERNENNPARKRRRRCGKVTTATSSDAGNKRSSLPDLVDDSNLSRLSENNYPPRDNNHKKEIALRTSLPSLLFRRQVCGSMGSFRVGGEDLLSSGSHERLLFGSMTQIHVRAWQDKILTTTSRKRTKHDGVAPKKTSWRPYARREISFVDLGTPYTEALLALDPSGSCMLTVCDDVEQKDRLMQDKPSAYICVRGVPSPATLQQNADNDSAAFPSSPRLLTIPLDFAVQGVRQRFSKRKVILSIGQDWRMGLYLGPVSNTPRDPSAQVVVFPLPRTLHHDDEIVHVYKTSPVLAFPDVVGSMEGHNLFWEVEFCPRPALHPSADCHWYRQCSHFCVLQFRSELRLTWFTETNAAISLVPSTTKTVEMGRSLKDCLSCREDSIWEVAQSHRLDGSLVDSFEASRDTTRQRIEKAHEMILDMKRLVLDILQHRPKLAKRYNDDELGCQLDWKSEVIDVIHEGRVLNLLIAFSPGKAKHPVAVIVCIDLVSQTYRELSWMKSATVFAYIDMRTLCANFRMKLLRCGPFVSSERPDQETVEEAEEGAPGLHYTNQNQEYCFMPLSSLYTDTQVISNSNILCAVPRMSIKSRSPVELVYFGYG